MSQLSNARPSSYHLSWLSIRVGSIVTVEGPFVNTNDNDKMAPLRKILDRHEIASQHQETILDTVYKSTRDRTVPLSSKANVRKMIIMRREFNEEVAKAAASATTQQPLEIWTVFQPETEVYGTEHACKFPDEDTVDSFVKPGRANFNMGNISRRPASFLRKYDAIAHARNVLKQVMEMETKEDGLKWVSREYESEAEQGMTHGIIKDKFQGGVHLVSIVKSILPIVDT
ncbi:hypothetical protein HBH56_042060 [Parastagonospora nodorum]|uniref:Uncharacterized protein n=1 Tax=Phaeosphaeria nodorum (strain SN15 / ATCC MYA-4574 / FGSC 10173) TaxID=321614 RepID=A0A7U2EXW6_PHANO|nr:hypothetical protein HBH56_042060 [Parastagonospora nodorum]QRC92959.1 hypothetical protein JI435_079960 [Parastagonospora nodorum SN15]KAH3933037.1 hypothetical protein HBH54_069810 [Parastagonospora nodorum]KAH3943516.1 hypothetical protein HBH53_173980 [Parastagonospora nodorum]KAH3961803.1 hypothetical protein HBH52_229200 [Parastagonospora nodorum]